MKKTIIIVSFIFAGITAKAQTTMAYALQLLQQKNYVQALNVCNALLAESASDPSVLGIRSQVYTATGKYELAIQDADKALSIDQTSGQAYYAKAELFFYGKKDYQQSLQLYDAAMKANTQMAEAYAGKARAYMGMQKYKEAMNVIEDAIPRILQNDPELYYMRGLLNYQRGKFKLAIEDYDKSLVINSGWNTYHVLLNRGIAHDAILKPDLALQDFTNAIAADPNNVGGYIARGNILYGLAKYQDAVEDFRKAEILSPDNSVITYNIGMSYYKINDKASACRYFQKSCSQDNTNACKMVLMNCTDRK